jgi:hypothetical protein
MTPPRGEFVIRRWRLEDVRGSLTSGVGEEPLTSVLFQDALVKLFSNSKAPAATTVQIPHTILCATPTGLTPSSNHQTDGKAPKTCHKSSRRDLECSDCDARDVSLQLLSLANMGEEFPASPKNHDNQCTAKHRLMADVIHQRLQRRTSRRCPLGPSCRMKVGTALYKRVGALC